MKLLFWIVVALVAAVLALFAASNRESVTLGLWPLPFVVESAALPRDHERPADRLHRRRRGRLDRRPAPAARNSPARAPHRRARTRAGRDPGAACGRGEECPGAACGARLRRCARMQIIGGDEIHRLLDFPSLIDALRAMFREGCEVPARHHHSVAAATAEGTSGTLLVMPAWQAGRALGIKIVTVFPDNTTAFAARGARHLSAARCRHRHAGGAARRHGADLAAHRSRLGARRRFPRPAG